MHDLQLTYGLLQHKADAVTLVPATRPQANPLGRASWLVREQKLVAVGLEPQFRPPSNVEPTLAGEQNPFTANLPEPHCKQQNIGLSKERRASESLSRMKCVHTSAYHGNRVTSSTGCGVGWARHKGAVGEQTCRCDINNTHEQIGQTAVKLAEGT
jgi:hypothetical protein